MESTERTGLKETTVECIKGELNDALATCTMNVTLREHTLLSEIQRIYGDDNYNCTDDNGNDSNPRAILQEYINTGLVTGKGAEDAALKHIFRKYLDGLDRQKRLRDALNDIAGERSAQ